MPINDLEKLGQQLKTARAKVGLTQEQLSDLCHVSVKHIADIEKGKKNPSVGILIAICTVLKISLDVLISPDMTEEEEACKELAVIYTSCPPSVRATLLKSTRSLAQELTELTERIKTK